MSRSLIDHAKFSACFPNLRKEVHKYKMPLVSTRTISRNKSSTITTQHCPVFADSQQQCLVEQAFVVSSLLAITFKPLPPAQQRTSIEHFPYAPARTSMDASSVFFYKSSRCGLSFFFCFIRHSPLSHIMGAYIFVQTTLEAQ